MMMLTDEVERALSAELYYLAIMLTLAFPDVCAALESDDGKSSSDRYKAWSDAWFLPRYRWLDSIDLYSMRCGVVHQGRMGHPNLQFSRVFFTLPVPNNIVLHNNVINDALNLDAVTFCRDMIDAVTAWFAANASSPNVVANFPRLMRHYPNGLAPYVIGIPVIA